MQTILAVALGGAVGSLGRHWLNIVCERALGTEFPWGIFLANVVGSLLIGVCYVLIVEKSLLGEVWRSLLMIGFLGAFTTFSTFSLQTIQLVADGRMLAAAGYVLGSVILSILAAFAAITATRQIW